MDRQESEVLALTSIFDESVFIIEKHPTTELYSGCYSCHFKQESPILVITRADDNILKSAELNYLAPIHLYFTLPLEYPANGKPSFTLASCWLKPTQFFSIRGKLNDMLSKNAGSEILFDWFNYLKYEVLDDLKIGNTVDLTAVAKESELFLRKVAHKPELSAGLDVSLASAAERLRQCENFDLEQEAADLMSTPFYCAICLCDRIGKSAAIIKPCRHLFCKVCLSNYFKSKVEDGAVQEIVCPSEKCTTVVTTSLIHSVVDEKVYQRYDQLLLKMGLDSIGDLVYCPRSSCQYPVIFDKGTSSATCPSCGHAFCVFCRRTYHGVAACRFKPDEIEQLRTRYQAADSAEKQLLEERYGRITIKQAIEEYDSTLFLKDNCRQCPSCKAWCQKIEGCNKMSCTKCRSYFCWLCNKVLNRNDPYGHYSDPESGCQGRLFEGLNLLVENDEEEEEASDEDEEEEEDQDLAIFPHLEDQ